MSRTSKAVMEKTVGSPSRSTRIGVFSAVALLHLAAVFGLLRAFAPDFSTRAVDQVLSTFTVTITAPPPTAEPPPVPSAKPSQGNAAEAGRKATPAPTVVPPARIPLPRPPAPLASSSGVAITSGASASGAGTGGGGAGSGTGNGRSGSGDGAGAVKLAEKIAGEINSARDYPRESRALRIGDYVIVAMTVGTDGRASNCHVVRASRDPQAGAITCRLAETRFRFRPASDSQGRPVTSVYGWRQRWFL